MVKNISLLFLIWIAFSISYTAIAQEISIAGITPHSRPNGAPVINNINKDNSWYKHALQGISAPYPRSLQFLEDQGNWYTPFTRPGMLGPYDIRGFHIPE